MLQPKRYIPIISFLGAMIISGNAIAHTTVMSKNTRIVTIPVMNLKERPALIILV
ncbi:hypothetical protein [Candidatus Kuenenia stuttgartiensis]|uniref:hypothetical protein n=1 Tax=Kuenenia stuttgartiensis TaxID=174633 RepID=UPI00146BB3FE|nr:hypothetical protein [Candidatus Kuenenia stuttgartiensis]